MQNFVITKKTNKDKSGRNEMQKFKYFNNKKK